MFFLWVPFGKAISIERERLRLWNGLGDFIPDRLDSRSLRTLWEWKNRVLLEEYHIFDVAIPLEVEFRLVEQLFDQK